MRLAFGWVAVVLASAGAASGIGLGCVLELEHHIACGDGYVDPLAGEECDPGDVDSFEGACKAEGFPRGIADCHPIECTIVADQDQCERCGDGTFQPWNRVTEETADTGDTEGLLEQCDLGDLGGVTCPNGGQLRCDGQCQLDESMCLPYCGDGELQGDEECGDPGGGFAVEQACAPDDVGGKGIRSPYGDVFRYGSGKAQCSQCLWARGQCSYCGNGRRDESLLVDELTGLMSPPEKCDGDDIDKAELFNTYGDACRKANENWQPNARCDGCYGFAMENDAPACCVASGAYCPAPGDGIECCYAYEHPEDENPCDPAALVPATCKSSP